MRNPKNTNTACPPINFEDLPGDDAEEEEEGEDNNDAGDEDLETDEEITNENPDDEKEDIAESEQEGDEEQEEGDFEFFKERVHSHPVPEEPEYDKKTFENKKNRELVWKIVIDICRLESPLPVYFLTARLQAIFQIQRQTPKFLANVDEFLQELAGKDFVLKEGFIYQKGKDSFETIQPRGPEEDDESWYYRYHKDLSHEEIKAGLIKVLSEGKGVEKDFLLWITAKKFGINKFTQAGKEAFLENLTSLIAGGICVLEGEKVFLKAGSTNV